MDFRTKKLQAEVANGRLAMMAIIGMLLACTPFMHKSKQPLNSMFVLCQSSNVLNSSRHKALFCCEVAATPVNAGSSRMA